MKKERVIEIDVKNLLALCNILDEFEEFNERAISFFSGKDKHELLNKLIKVTKNEFCFNSRKVKKFYNENKKVIDTIKKYSYVWDFFSKGYCWNPKYTEELNYMYQYIKENRKDLDKIIAVLEKIKEYKIDNLQFNKDFDFTTETYTIYISIFSTSSYNYLDNLEVVPCYESDKIKYKTTGSNYKIDFRNCSRFLENIKLNSLNFDAEKLPNSSDREEMLNKLFSLRDEKKEEYDAIRSSVDLNIKIENMSSITSALESIIERIDNVKTKEELKKNLLTITSSLSKMQSITDNNDKENIEKSEFITTEVLEKEKKLYKERELYSYIDID